MTIGAYKSDQEIDFFSLDTRKKREVVVEMLDYDFVNKCTDVEDLKGVLATLRSGKEGRYPDLEKATEDRLLALMPAKERSKIIRMRSGPTRSEANNEKIDLASWMQEMESKEKELLRMSDTSKFVPPVRGQKTASKELKEVVTSASKKKKAIPAYDFRAWERYNVDEALEKVDEDEVRSAEESKEQQVKHRQRAEQRKKELGSLPSYVDIEALSSRSREVYALQEKQKGNECFKAGENDEAILYYTRSLAFDDTNAMVYANRAMAYLRIKSFGAAELDSCRAIELDPAYAKGWLRRGMTRVKRGKYADAVKDLDQALALDPNNKNLAKLRSKAADKRDEVNGSMSARPSRSSRKTSKPFTRFEVIQEEEEEEEEEEEKFQRFEIIEE